MPMSNPHGGLISPSSLFSVNVASLHFGKINLKNYNNRIKVFGSFQMASSYLFIDPVNNMSSKKRLDRALSP